MLRRAGGHIVNVSSAAAVVAFPGMVSYAASKAALSHFTAGLRADRRGLPVSTTLVEIGTVATELLGKAQNCAPSGASFQRMYRLRLSVDVPREKAAAETVEAVRKNRRHVRVPRRLAPFTILAEIPRRTTEFLLTGVAHQAR